MTPGGRRFEPLVQESTPAIIADRLRRAISRGELPAGSQLGEARLAAELGVSRGPLREGMQRLTQEGLLVSIRNRGVFVLEMTAADVRDMYVARTAVERAALEQIFEGATGAAATALGEVCDAMASASESDDAAGIARADVDFHRMLVALAGSPRLSRMHQTFLTETEMCITALGGTYPPPDVRVPEHRAIAEAVAAGDAAKAVGLLLSHMHDAVERLVTVVPPG